MTLPMILAPVFVQIGLTFVLMMMMGRARVGALQAGECRIPDIALGEQNWPPRVRQVANAFHNQLELPVLFYILVAFAILTRKADLLFVAMSWLFVVLRIAHAIIHVTTNRLPQRAYVFFVGAILLMAMWTIFAVRVLAGL